MEKPDSIDAKWTLLDLTSRDWWELRLRILNSAFHWGDNKDLVEDIEDNGITIEDAWELYVHMGINQAQPNVEYFPHKAREIREAIILRIARDELKNKLE